LGKGKETSIEPKERATGNSRGGTIKHSGEEKGDKKKREDATGNRASLRGWSVVKDGQQKKKRVFRGSRGKRELRDVPRARK